MGTGAGGQRGRSLALAIAAAGLIAATQPPSAGAAYAHTVVEGESLSGIAAANGISTESLAAFNGISAETLVISGTIVQIPSATETGTAAAAGTTGAAHTVTEGETLSGIAAANGISTESLATFNGISAETLVITGTTLQVPSGITTTTTTSGAAPTTAPATVPASWVSEIYSPNGTAYLASNAAAAWSAMRDASLSQFGIDIYPAGPLSGYRTWEQQSYLYNLFLTGVGAPANPPGTSSHEYGTAVDLASPEMRTVIDQIGPTYGWSKIHGPDEWWHVDYVGG
jgi:LysM repeat protein